MKRLIPIALLLYIPFQSLAWGLLGHRITGEIADSYLSPKTRVEIKKILGNESVAMAGNWGDFIKSDPAYSYLSPWHYVDIDETLSLPELRLYLKNDTSVNAYNKINFLVSELKKKTLAADKKLMYLRLLIHIVEDIHQPFHVGHVSDKGGNDIKLTWFGKAINLHSLWDSELIESQQLSYTEYAKAINYISPAKRLTLQKQNLAEWIHDSHVLAGKLYEGVKKDDKLGYKYNFDNLAILNQQLLKGGVHLAGLLNGIFAD